MISLPRSALNLFRSVIRRSFPRQIRQPLVAVRSGSRGRGLEVVTPELALRLLIPGRGPAEMLGLPASSLELFAGRGDEDVCLAAVDGGQVAASWTEGDL